MRTSLRTRLTVTFIGLAILPLLLMGLVLARQSFVVQQQQALALQSEVARRVSTAVSAFVQGLESELRMVVQVEGLGNMNLAQQQAALSRLMSYQGSFASLTLLDWQGRETVSLARLRAISPDEMGDRSQTPEFLVPLQTARTYYSPVRLDQVLGEPLMTIAVPLVAAGGGATAGGQVIGVLVADARLKQMWDVIASIPVGEGGSVYIVSAEGRVIAHRNPATVLRGARFDVPADPGVHDGLDAPRVVMAMDTIRLGDQVLNVVAEQSLSQALSLALSALAITGILTVAALILAGSVGLTAVRRIARPIEILDTTAQAITAGDLSRQTEVIGRDELGHLAQAFNTMTARLRETLSGLEQQVTDRTLDAERRTQQIQAAADVGKAAASIRNLDELLTRVAYLISERFGFYHAGVFLLDPQGEHVILHAASSPGGQRMLERGHRLRVGEAGSSLAAGENTAAGIVGHVASTMEARIALDVGQDATFFDNPDLPDTRSEMALPLMAGGRLLGVLDVQSTKAGAFGEEDIGVLQVLADQVAVAIENAQLFAETQRTLDVERRAYGQVSRVAWRDLLRLQRARGYRCDPQGVFAIAAGDQPGAAPAPELVGEPAPQDGATLLLPIQVRDHTLGFVRLRKPDEAHAWTAEEVALMDLLAEQLGVALESARLYADTQRRVAREQLVGQVTARIRETLDVETVLQTAIREMGSALGIPKIEVRLGRQLARPGDGRDEGKEGNGHVGLD